MAETELVKRLMIHASSLGHRLFRNNVGLGWAGKSIDKCHGRTKTVMLFPGDVVVRSARPLHAGLCKGSSDLIGWRRLLITQEMVGTEIAQFAAAEVKTTRGAHRDEQTAFVKTVTAQGGRAAFVTSISDLEGLLLGI